MKYCDKILQPPLRMSAHIIQRKLNILGTNPKSEETVHFCGFQNFYSDYVKQNCHVLAHIFVHLGTFIAILLTGNIQVWFLVYQNMVSQNRYGFALAT